MGQPDSSNWPLRPGQPTACPVEYKYTRPVGLLGLPNELVFLIIKDVGENELVELALSCRRLHFCAIHLYLARHGFEDPTYLRSVTLSSKHTNVFPALRISLFMTRIGKLRYQFSSGFHSEIRQLTRLLSKLTRVEQLILDFTHADYWALSFPVKGEATLFFREWVKNFEDLFEAAFQKSCAAVKVFGGRVYPAASQSYGITGLDDAVVWRESLKPRDKHPPNSRLVSLFYSGVDPLREVLGFSSISHKTRQSHPTLKLFHVHSPMLLHPAHSCWTIQTLNISPITDLSFMYLYFPSSSWDKILPSITVPTLSRLSIAYCNMSCVALSKFLSRHRQVISLSLGEGLPIADDFPPSRKAAFHQLTSLTAPIDYVFQLLSLPRLRLLSIYTSIPSLRLLSTHTGIYSGHPPQFMSVLLASVVARDILLSMTLVLTTDDDRWLDSLVDEGYISINHVLHDITRLVICANPNVLSTKMITQFPVWLASFPLLEHITFVATTESWEIGSSTLALIRSIRAKCAGVQSVKLSDVEHCVTTWLAMRV